MILSLNLRKLIGVTDIKPEFYFINIQLQSLKVILEIKDTTKRIKENRRNQKQTLRLKIPP